MDSDKMKTIPSTDEELDDPYVHTVSTEEFVENVERASDEEKTNGSIPNEE